MELKFKKNKIVTLPVPGKSAEWQLNVGRLVAMIEVFNYMKKCKPAYRGRIFKTFGNAFEEILISPKFPELSAKCGWERYFADDLKTITTLLLIDRNITAEVRRVEEEENDAAREAVMPKERKDLNG